MSTTATAALHDLAYHDGKHINVDFRATSLTSVIYFDDFKLVLKQ